MAYNFKESLMKKERFTSGHRMCAGCGAPIVVKSVLRALHDEDHAVIACATGCLEVSSFIYPYTSWNDSFIHTAFENAGATLSGVEAAYTAMKKTGKLPQDKNTKFIAFGGDGGNRNRVRKLIHTAFSGCSQSFRFPSEVRRMTGLLPR